MSAVVGAVVSLLVVSQTTVRRRRAERREAAREAVTAAVAPLLVELGRYRYQVRRPEPKRAGEQADLAHLEDHAQLVTIRTAAADLPGWRRWLVDRRCRRIFGNYWNDLARDYPTRTDADTLTAWLAVSMNDGASGDPRQSLIHRTYAEPPGHALGAELARELRRLSAAR